ncbi:MAG: cation:proton antiporter [archaeon]|nr:MAG: cation:proton antiporter [archaeon]
MDVNIIFILVAAIIAIGFFSNYFFKKTRIPDLIWLIIFGAIVGPILGLIEASFFMTYISIFAAVALLIILFEGGSSINIYSLIKESFHVLFLTILGFILSVFMVAFIGYTFFGLEPLIALLLGAIIGGTSSPIVFPLVESMYELKKDVGLILKMESVITDPMAIIVSLVLIETILISPAEGFLLQGILANLVSLLSISLVLGFFGGVIWGSIWHRFVHYKYHYMMTIGFLFLIYVAVELTGGSGAIAAFMVGLVLGNMPSIKRMLKIKQTLTGLTKETRDFNSYIAFFVRTFFFALIGMIIQLSRLELIFYGVLLSLALLGIRTFVIRMCTYKMQISDRQKNIMSLTYPRGLAAAVLASLPFIEYNIPGTDIFTEIVFTVIVTTVLVSTIGVAVIEKKNRIKRAVSGESPKKTEKQGSEAPKVKDV